MLESIDPANGSFVASVPLSTASDVAAAVDKAWNTFRTSGWKDRLPHVKASVFHDIARRLRAEK